jgi:very-short-patch-repair endonuclease
MSEQFEIDSEDAMIHPPRPPGTPPREGVLRREIIGYERYLKELARKLRNNMTFGEVLLWQQLKRKQMRGFDFDRQRPIDRYIVDFYCKDLKLAIEIDGSSHDSEEARERDEIRQKRLESLGVKFLRFSDDDVRHNMPTVLATIDGSLTSPEIPLLGGVPAGRGGCNPIDPLSCPKTLANLL